MNPSSFLAKTITSMALVVASLAANAGVTVGVGSNGNCYPFICMAGDGKNHQQQVYAASAFSGPISVDSVSFFRFATGLLDSASYSVSFYTTPSAVNGLSTNLATNRGSLLSAFGTFNLSGTTPEELTLDGTDFLYDPSMGNLLMEVSVLGLTTGVGYGSYFQGDYAGLVTQRVFSTNGITGEVDTGALVTRFNTGNVVPEPESLALVGLGLMALVVTRRRNSK